MNTKSTPLAILFVLSSAFPAKADPVQWSTNGHYYDVVDVSLIWPDARDLAGTMDWNGYVGHLATITSAEEQVFLQQAFSSALDNCWLGGYQEPKNSPPAEDWHWVTGEPWGYTNWRGGGLPGGEPNDAGGPGAESWLEVHGAANQTWNDYGPDYSPRPRFVIEYDLGTVPVTRSTWAIVKNLYR